MTETKLGPFGETIDQDGEVIARPDAVCTHCRQPVNANYPGGTPSGLRRGYRHHDSWICIRALGDALNELRASH